MRRAGSVSGSDSKVKLSSASSTHFHKSSHSDEKWAPRIERKQSEYTSGPAWEKLNEILEMRF